MSSAMHELPFPSAPAAKNPGKMKMLSQSHSILGQVLRVCSPRGPGLQEGGKPGGGRCLSLLCALLHRVRAKAERWNEEMAPRKCPRCSCPCPSAPPLGFQRRREGELCSTSPQSGCSHPYQRIKPMNREFLWPQTKPFMFFVCFFLW